MIRADIAVLTGHVERVEGEVAGLKADMIGMRADMRSGATRMDGLAEAIGDARETQAKAATEASRDRQALADRLNAVSVDVASIASRLPKAAQDLPFWQGVWAWAKPSLGPLVVGIALGMILITAAFLLGREGLTALIQEIRP